MGTDDDYIYTFNKDNIEIAIGYGKDVILFILNELLERKDKIKYIKITFVE